MPLGSFGGSAPILPMAKGAGGSVAVDDALDRARELQSPSPEGQVALREQVQTSQITGVRIATASSTVTTTSTTDTALDSMTHTYTQILGNTGSILMGKVNVANDTIAATVTVTVAPDSTAQIESEAIATSPVGGQVFSVSPLFINAALAVVARTDKLVWRVSAGTGSALRRVFLINEQYR